MANVKRSISVTEQQNQWVKARIASGDFGNESEVYRALIRKAQAEEKKLNALRSALQEGQDDIDNGRFRDLKTDAEILSFFSELKAK